MAYEAKPGTFSLFKNDKKESDKHPDYRGDGKDADGNAIWVSAWLKEGKSGKFMSCSFKLKDEQAKPKVESFIDNLDDKIPF
jgi:uncharacterized protein (DUF736 family)